MKSLQVVGFNSAKYELCLIHKYLISTLKNTDCSEKLGAGGDDDGNATSSDHIYVIKRGNAVVSLRTPWLHFLDICNYCAPATSYSWYLQTYGKDLDRGKSFFPYDLVTSFEVLDCKGMPPYDSFFSPLKGHNTLEEGSGDRQVGLENYGALWRTWEQEAGWKHSMIFSFTITIWTWFLSCKPWKISCPLTGRWDWIYWKMLAHCRVFLCVLALGVWAGSSSRWVKTWAIYTTL